MSSAAGDSRDRTGGEQDAGQQAAASTSMGAQDGQEQEQASPTGTIRPLPDDTAAEATTTTTPATTTAGRAFQDGIRRENLDKEVEQVMGTLGSWWGGVKKQSASALTSFKADLDKTVSQAQAELEYLRTAKVEIVVKTDELAQAPEAEAEEAEAPEDKEAGDKEAGDKEAGDKGKGKATGLGDAGSSAAAVQDAATSILDRLSSSTSKLQSTLQSTFSSTLASAANQAQLRDQLAAGLHLQSAKHNLQLSMKQAEKLAEEYMKKSDQWVKDAERWMGDAVKIVPPEDDDTRFVTTSWDGADFYAFSTSTPVSASKDDDWDAQTPRPSVSNPALLAGSRKEALLTRLREDKDLLLVDPEDEAESDERRQAFRQWVNEKWPQASKDRQVGDVGAIRMALVPEHLTDEQFWQRYLFHKEMIEAEDERRKKLVEATEQTANDDFSWDDDPEAEDTTTPLAASRPARPKDAQLAAPVPKTSASAATSPRDSEESYDLVSDQGGTRTKPAAADDDDSDWE